MPLNPTKISSFSNVAPLTDSTRTCHVEGETSVGSIEGTPVYEVSSEASRKDGAGGINADANPSEHNLRQRIRIGDGARRTG